MKFSGETWVGNLYQKFEAVCHEVDGLVSKEHIKNLESHVQSVGNNVMKLCSNVKDLLPSSLGDFTLESSQKLLEMDVTDSLRSNETRDEVSDEDLLETRIAEEPSSSSSELPFGESDGSVISEDHDEDKQQSSDVSEQVCPESSLIDQNSDSLEKQPNSGVVTKEEEESPSNFRESIFPDKHLCERAITVFCGQNHSLADQVPGFELHLKKDMISENTDENSTAFLASLELCHHCEADFFSSERNTSNWSVIEIGTPSKEKAEDEDSGSLASTDFANDEGLKSKQMEFSVRFEGSCVFVETDSIQADPCAFVRANSRKKRVKGAFFRRKKLEKEYKQLALWYGDIDAELDDECSQQKLISPSHDKHLSSQESEWELL